MYYINIRVIEVVYLMSCQKNMLYNMFIIRCISFSCDVIDAILGLKVCILSNLALTLQRKKIEERVSSEIRYNLYCRKSVGIRRLSEMP